MANNERVQSSIGAAQNYGPRTTNEGLPACIADARGVTRELVLPFSYDQLALPGSINADVDAAVALIPANALLKAAYLKVTVDFETGTSAVLNVGTELEDGTTVSATAIYAAVASTALDVGDWPVAGGAVVGATVGTAAVQLSVTQTVGTFTAGEATLIIEYIDKA